MTNKFSKSEALKFGWKTMKCNFWFFVGALIIVGIVEVLTNIPLLGILFWILFLIMQIGLLKILLKLYDNEKPSLGNLFKHYSLFFKFLAGMILYALIVLLGSILFILFLVFIWFGGGFTAYTSGPLVFLLAFALLIPSIVLGIKYQFFGYLIADKGMGPISALKKSGEITRGAKWSLFLLGLLIALINLAGALVFLVGLFATIPTGMMAMTHAYRKLLNQIEVSTAVSESPPLSRP